MKKLLILLLSLTVGILHAQPDSLWSRTYGGLSREGCNSVIQTRDGGFALAGYQYIRDSEQRNDGYLVKTDSRGEIEWERTYGPDNNINYDEWDAVIDSDPAPENGFEEGLLAMRRGELESSASLFRTWIVEAPDSPKAPAAVRILFRVERDLECDLGDLRDEYLELASNCDDYPDLGWTAKRLAVRCLYEQGQFDRAISEYQDIRDEAPDEIEAILVDIDIMFIEETADGDEIDAARSRNIRLDAAFARIDEIEARQEDQRESSIAPESFELTAVYPNPFNNSLRIGFSIMNDAEVRLAIYDLSGRFVEEIGRGHLKSGRYTKVWNATSISAGTYLIRLETAERSITRKVALIK